MGILVRSLKTGAVISVELWAVNVKKMPASRIESEEALGVGQSGHRINHPKRQGPYRITKYSLARFREFQYAHMMTVTMYIIRHILSISMNLKSPLYTAASRDPSCEHNCIV